MTIMRLNTPRMMMVMKLMMLMILMMIIMMVMVMMMVVSDDNFADKIIRCNFLSKKLFQNNTPF